MAGPVNENTTAGSARPGEQKVKITHYNGLLVGRNQDNPWSIDHEDGHDATWFAIATESGRVIAVVLNDDSERPLNMHQTELEANAARLATCWNACEGTPDSLLKPEAFAEVATQRDLLLAALEEARDTLDNVQGDINPERGYADELEDEVSVAYGTASAATAAVKGSAPTLKKVTTYHLLAALKRTVDYHVPGVNPLSDAANLSAKHTLANLREGAPVPQQDPLRDMLVSSVLAWWEAHQSDDIGGRNVYDQEPEFVVVAQAMAMVGAASR